MTGQDLYEVWKGAMDDYEPDSAPTRKPWRELSVSQQAAWECVAEETS